MSPISKPRYVHISPPALIIALLRTIRWKSQRAPIFWQPSRGSSAASNPVRMFSCISPATAEEFATQMAMKSRGLTAAYIPSTDASWKLFLMTSCVLSLRIGYPPVANASSSLTAATAVLPLISVISGRPPRQTVSAILKIRNMPRPPETYCS